MNKLLAFVLVAVFVLPVIAGLGGCCKSDGTGPAWACHTMVLDPLDHQKQIARNIDLDCRQLCEDIDYLLLWDQPSHLTSWYMPSKPH